jgi:[acyl-carrier-protein] S-malonyltransferase
MNEIDNATAFIFPGQGSQSQGMLSGLAAEFAIVRQTFDRASELLDTDLWTLVERGPEEKLDLTQNTQPAMLAAGVAVYRILMQAGSVRPGWMAGHSLGEYSALVCAEALDYAHAVRLVADRARLMQGAIPPGAGAMAAILGLSDEQVIDICGRIHSESEVVAPANFNAPGQVVIAGHAGAVKRAAEAAKQAGARRAVLLPVSVPSHSPLMMGAATQFRESLARTPMQGPQIPVIHNTDAATHDVPAVLQSILEQQLYSPVRWVDCIRSLQQRGVRTFIECGPGKVLNGLIKRIVPDGTVLSVFDPGSLNTALELLA